MKKLKKTLIVLVSIYAALIILTGIPRGFLHLSPKIEIEAVDYYTGEPVNNVVVGCEWVSRGGFSPGGPVGYTLEKYHCITGADGKAVIPSRLNVNLNPTFSYDSQYIEIEHPGYYVEHLKYFGEVYNSGHYFPKNCKIGWLHRFTEIEYRDGMLKNRTAYPETIDGKVTLRLRMLKLKDLYKEKPWVIIWSKDEDRGFLSFGKRDAIHDLCYYAGSAFWGFKSSHKDSLGFFSMPCCGEDRKELEEMVAGYDDIEKLWVRYQEEIKNTKDENLIKNFLDKKRFEAVNDKERLLGALKTRQENLDKYLREK